MPVRSLATLAFIALVQQNNVYAPEVKVAITIKEEVILKSRTISRRCRQIAKGKTLFFRYEKEARCVRNIALKRGFTACSVEESPHRMQKISLAKHLNRPGARGFIRKGLYCFTIDD